jgi:hypothetical protein
MSNEERVEVCAMALSEYKAPNMWKYTGEELRVAYREQVKVILKAAGMNTDD